MVSAVATVKFNECLTSGTVTLDSGLVYHCNDISSGQLHFWFVRATGKEIAVRRRGPLFKTLQALWDEALKQRLAVIQPVVDKYGLFSLEHYDVMQTAPREFSNEQK
jgi:hypothetical protein